MGIEYYTEWYIDGFSKENFFYRYLGTELVRFDKEQKIEARKDIILFALGNFIHGDLSIYKNINENVMENLDKNVKNMIYHRVLDGTSTYSIRFIQELWHKYYTMNFIKDSEFIKDEHNFIKNKFNFVFVKDEGGHGVNIEYVYTPYLDDSIFKKCFHVFEAENEKHKNDFHIYIRIRFAF